MANFDIAFPEHVLVDKPLQSVVETILELDPDGSRISKVVRRSFDQLYDGRNTGRYRVDQLYKTEKTHFGTILEINLQREFKFHNGDKLDYEIAGHDVDCKFSFKKAWMLPPESFDRLVLLTYASDKDSVWGMGITRVTEERRRSSHNRDQKTGLNRKGREEVFWIFDQAALPSNALVQLPREAVEHILSLRSGQSRIDQLFRTAAGMLISRNVIATVGQQDDYMKRVRGNGGSRTTLQPEGYLIISGKWLHHREIAASLGLPVPHSDELVSAQVVPSDETGTKIGDHYWRVALPGEEITTPAPLLPNK